MVAERAGWRQLLVMAGLGCLGFGCGSDDEDGNPTNSNYPCQVSALILANFSGSCDTRPTTTTPGECRAWYDSSTTAASQACTDLGGTFNDVERCPSTSRVLRCAIEDSGFTIMHSYYAPTYSEASAAEICSSRGGKCVRGTGD